MISQPPASKLSPARLSRRDALRLIGAAGALAVLSTSRLRADAPAPAAKPVSSSGEQPGFYRFRIGAFDALALNDGGIVAPPERPWTGGTKEQVVETLDAAAMPTAQVELPFGVILVRTGTECLLVDTGSARLFGSTAGRLPSSLRAAGVRPEEVTSIIITHAHSDHFGGLLDPVTKAPVFPNAKLFIRRREYDYWIGEKPDVSAMVISVDPTSRLFTTAREYLRTFEGQWRFVEPGDKPIEGVEIIDAAGHTPGQIGVLISSGPERLLHLADAVHHHAVSFAHPEWVYNFDTLPKLAAENRRRLLDRAASERLRVFGSHLPFPGLGRVRKAGDAYEHVIEPWVSVLPS